MRCYCCGEELGKTFALVAYRADADRAFVMKKEHTNRVDEAAVVTVVKVQA
jgi:hypothetical protein